MNIKYSFLNKSTLAPISNIPYRKWYIAGFIFTIVTAWFSVGYHHPDEHFQVFEFCNYKLGLSPAKDLPWEFAANCRSAIQPFKTYVLSKALQFLGIYNPFTIAFILRLLMGIFAFWVNCKLIKQFLPDFKSDTAKLFFVGCSFLLWFLPYITVRFSAENVSGVCFFMALSLIYTLDKDSGLKFISDLIFAGLLLGFTFFLRLQMGFGIVALGLWLILNKKLNFIHWVIFILSGLFAVYLSIGIDYWFYGKWIFTPSIYFNLNIIQNVAAKFGVFPWWYYFSAFFEKGVPPISLLLIILCILGIWQKPKHIISFVFLFFLLGHFAIGHKELRFIYPLVLGLPYLVAIGLQKVMEIKFFNKKAIRISFKFLILINYMLLVYKAITPAQEMIKYYEFVYNFSKKHTTTFFAFNKSPYSLDGTELNFYKPKNINAVSIKDSTELNKLLSTTNVNNYVLYLSHTLKPGPELNGYKVEKLYCLFPDWLLKYNINNWQDRSYLWVVFRIYNKVK